MPRTVRVLLAALALLGALAPAAAARDRLLAVASPPFAASPSASSPMSFAGPQLAGERLAWGTRAQDGAVSVRTAGEDGAQREILSLPALASDFGAIVLAASPSVVALGRQATVCDSDCRTSSTVARDLWAGSVDGPLARITGCSPAGPPCDAATPSLECFSGLTAAASRVALASACQPGLQLYDLSSSPPSQRSLPGVPQGSLAGPYLATATWPSAPGKIIVYDLTTDVERYRVDAPQSSSGAGPLTVLVQGDGKVVVSRTASFLPTLRFESWWASPADPVLHPIALGDAGPPVRFAGDRIAALRTTRDDRTVSVLDLDGRVVERVAITGGPGDVDFDGQRLAWSLRPCRTTFLAVRDLAEHSAMPAPDAGPCPAALASRKAKRLDAAGGFALKLACPAEPALGCDGRLRLLGQRPRARGERPAGSKGRYFLGGVPYHLEPDTRGTFPVALARGARKFVTASGTVSVRATSIAIIRRDGPEDAEPAVRERTFTLSAARG